MKLLCDANISLRSVIKLREEGYDTLSMLELDPGATDEYILKKAYHEKRIVVTYDKDFGDLVFRDKKNHSGVVILRPKDESWKSQVASIQKFLQTFSYKEIITAVWIVEDSSVRRR